MGYCIPWEQDKEITTTVSQWWEYYVFLICILIDILTDIARIIGIVQKKRSGTFQLLLNFPLTMWTSSNRFRHSLPPSPLMLNRQNIARAVWQMFILWWAFTFKICSETKRTNFMRNTICCRDLRWRSSQKVTEP